MNIRALSKNARELQQSSIVAHPNIIFWLGFLSLNAILFLPYFLLSGDMMSPLPPLLESQKELSLLARELLVWRNSLDVLRLNLELFLLFIAWIFLPGQKAGAERRLFLLLLSLSYFITLAYAVYESVNIFVYQTDAVFYAQFLLAIDGFKFLLDHLQLSPVFVGLVLGAIIMATSFLVFVIRVVTKDKIVNNLSLGSRAALIGLFILCVYALLFNRSIMSSPKSVVSSQIAKLYKNIEASLSLIEEVKALDTLELPQVYDYTGYTLLTKPNIYLIFVESYGSILYKREAFSESYFDILAEKQEMLQSDGWFTASAMSESPTWGGGSWMAYTSLLFGLRVDNHPQYLTMLEKFQDQDYPDLGFSFRSFGYRYIRATSLAVELSDEEWQKYVNFFGVDDWIRYRDLDYQGVHYGWGPSPPDQFVLSAAHERIVQESADPFLLFLITQNSHYPWRKVPLLVEDWRALNDGNAVVTIFDDDSTPLQVKQENYLEATAYELDFLTDFILNQAGDNDVFILVGDHQPGYVSRRDDGFETPIHVIAKDRSFVEAFENFGFEPDLKISNMTPAVKHEGFYSLFMYVFLSHYGQGTKAPPPYLPNGIDLHATQITNIEID